MDMEVDSTGDVETRQTTKIRKDQKENSAGGFVWKIDDLMKLKRFIVLGCEGGTYYSSQKSLTVESVSALKRLVDSGRGPEAVEVIRSYSVEGRTAKQDNLLFALALCARYDNLKTKQAAYSKLKEICRIPTHLFQFLELTETLSKPGTGWGRAQRRAVSEWYLRFQSDPSRLAMLATKYKNRNGWSHRDALRLSHPKTDNCLLNFIFQFCVKDFDSARAKYGEEVSKVEGGNRLIQYLEATDIMRQMELGNEEMVIELIREHLLVREHIPTPLLSSCSVMRTLLYDMPLTALLRSLAKITSMNMLTTYPELVHEIHAKLIDDQKLHSARIHPVNVLLAWKTYSKGRGDKGSLRWEPHPVIVKSLEEAFYKAFKNVKPTGKRFLLAVDVSGSMSSPANPVKVISCCEAAAALAMVTARSEKDCIIHGFSDKFKKLGINNDDRLEDVLKKTRSNNFGATDCALPMQEALKKRWKIDVFMVFTDSETYYGKVHPSQALVKYRNATGIWDAKLIVMAMTANNFTIADPNDPGMLDVVGFDSAAPAVIQSFINGEI